MVFIFFNSSIWRSVIQLVDTTLQAGDLIDQVDRECGANRYQSRGIQFIHAKRLTHHPNTKYTLLIMDSWKCPLSPFLKSNVVLSCLVLMAAILARLVQKVDRLSALQLNGALFTINWGTLCQTHLPPPIHPYPPASAPPPRLPLFGPLRRPCCVLISLCLCLCYFTSVK